MSSRNPPLERVFRHATDPILIEDLEGIVLDLNREAERTYGFPREELIGSPILTIVPDERHDQAKELLVRCRRGEEVRNVESLRKTKGGEVVPVLLTLSLLPDESGKPAAVATFAKDIRSLKAVEAALLDTKAQLEGQVAERTLHLREALSRMQATNERLEHELIVARELNEAASRGSEVALLGQSTAIRALRKAVVAMGRLETSVLLTGPPGAGHESVARAIHLASERRDRPFVKVNCGELDPLVASDALERWAPGSKLQVARGGTLYLEHIDRLSSDAQPALAAWLAEQSPDVDGVRVMAATVSPTGVLGRECELDPSLHTQLAGASLRLPSLVERREDIPLLVEAMLEKHADAVGRAVDGVTEETLERFAAYHWPGNLRELDSLLGRAVMRAEGGRLDVQAALLGTGDEVGGYHLVEKIGEGGMGEVWRGSHALLARPAAVKLIRPRRGLDARAKRTLRARFELEARVTASLRSPHTVELYDFGWTSDGRFYFVMEYLVGFDLHRALYQWGALPVGRVLHLLRQACASLAEAHDAGLVHRDITAANLFVCRLGGVCDFLKVLDFGVVRDPRDRDGYPRALLGTPATMAPEAFAGGELDHRADIYALGCVAYWMLTHTYPFEGATVEEVMAAHRRRPPVPPSRRVPGIPTEVDSLVLSCLEKRPEDRPRSARTIGRRVAQLLERYPWRDEDAEREWDGAGLSHALGDDVELTRWNGVTRITDDADTQFG